MKDSTLNFWLIFLWGTIGMIVVICIGYQYIPDDPNSISNRCERLNGSQSIYRNEHLCLLEDGRIIDLRRNEHIGAE